MCCPHSSALRVERHRSGFGAQASSGLWCLFLAGLLSVHLSWLTFQSQELPRRRQRQAALLETNMPSAAAALKELQTAPSRCQQQQRFCQRSWCAARPRGSQLGSTADAALPSGETPSGLVPLAAVPRPVQREGSGTGVLGCPVACSLVSLLLALKFTECSWLDEPAGICGICSLVQA